MTKTGDRGTTGIFGGERVPKDDIRIEANGTMDELNAHLGLIRSHLAMDDPRHRFFGEVQMRIMQAMSLIATRSERREENPNHFELSWVEDLEAETARLMKEILQAVEVVGCRGQGAPGSLGDTTVADRGRS